MVKLKSSKDIFDSSKCKVTIGFKYILLPLNLKETHFNAFANRADPDQAALVRFCLTLYLIETPFNTFANRADLDQAALIRAASSRSILVAYGNMIRYDPTLVDLASNLFVICTNVKVYLYNYS